MNIHEPWFTNDDNVDKLMSGWVVAHERLAGAVGHLSGRSGGGKPDL